MAHLSRNTSAPTLLNLDDNTYVIIGLKSPTDDEEDDSEGDALSSSGQLENDAMFCSPATPDSEITSPFESSPMSHLNAIPSFKGECLHQSLLPDRFYSQETLASEPDSSPSVQPRLTKKTRRAPQPPNMSPASSLRHSYAMGSLGSSEFSHLRNSTDTESITSESRLIYHTSTDSDTMLPESARGSNFPGELAGVENLQQLRDRMVVSPRTAHSRFKILRDKLGRSPQVGRRRSKKGKDEKSSPKLMKARKEEETKSPRLQKFARVDSDVELSDIVFALGYDSLEIHEEFEIKRVPDFDKFLTDLLSDTDPSHPDYEDLCKASKRVHSMVRERDDDLYEPDNQTVMDSIQGRFPLDDLHLTDSQHIDRYNISTNTLSMSTNGSNGNDNDNPIVGSPDETDKGLNTKSKGISLRRRSAPSAVILKSLTGSRSRSSNSLWSNAAMGKKDQDFLQPTAFRLVNAESNRMFLMEGPVQLATGMQIQERYLFLFTDLLLVAKQKSSSSFKLKCRVQLCDMWIASCIDEVSEITRPLERSFVIGWPTTNVVASFPDLDTKQKWLQALSESITQEKVKDEQKTVTLKVDTKDVESVEKACQMSISNVTTAKDVLTQCLSQLGLSESESADYHLWVLSGKEGSPYPLIGHETPFSIKLSQERELVSRSKSRDDLENMTSGDIDSVDDRRGANATCEFYLKQKKSPKKHFDNSAFQKSLKKTKKSPGLFNRLFRTNRQPQSQVFGHALSELCDENMDPPESIMKLMVHVYRYGPNIAGILRRGNNASLGKDIREKIDTAVRYTLEDYQAPTAASVFKEFLRFIPGGLLSSSLRGQWTAINMDDPENVKVEKIKEILKQLPPHNYRLLMYTICLLQHLAKHSEVTNMGPGNLSTCIAPSFCASQTGPVNHNKWPALASHESLKEVQDSMMDLTNTYTPLVTFMIIKHREIFGDEILNMFVKYDCIASPPISLEEDKQEESSSIHTNTEDEAEEDMEEDEEDEEMISFSNQQVQKRFRTHRLHRQLPQQSQRNSNSGTDSDSTHSVLSMPDTAVRRDDSSVDSLVDREYYPTENDSSPKPVKSHLSPSNLSRDSGLTLSDTQLYDEDVDMTMTAGQMYGRSSNFEDLDGSNPIIFSRSLDPTRDRRLQQNPVPPPRTKLNKKNRISSESSRIESVSYVSQFPQHPPPFKHSASTTQLDIHALSKSASKHPQLGKRISSDSISEELQPLERPPVSQDIGTIVKTDSGTHLYLHDETSSGKYNPDTAQKREHQFQRQTSATDSTPPVSPQSHLSQSSRDSLLSDSTYSISRDSPFHSAPQTPDSPSEKPPAWVPHSSKAFKPWNESLNQNPNNDYKSVLSKSTSDIRRQGTLDNEDNFKAHFEAISETSPNSTQIEDDWSNAHIEKYKPSSTTFNKRKSHEAEEIDSSAHLPFSLMTSADNNVEEEVKKAMASEVTHRHSSSDIHSSGGRFYQLLQGSPPPNVLLQNLPYPNKKDSLPMKASYDEAIIDQLRRSSTGTGNYPSHVPSNNNMNATRSEDYQKVAPKPIMIQQNASGTKNSKSVVRNADISSKEKGKEQPLSEGMKRPENPPCYQQALQRNFMIKQNVPVDIAMGNTEDQIENSSHARAMYEKSLKLYNEQRKCPSEAQKSGAKFVSSSQSKDADADFQQAEKSKLSPVISSSVNNNRLMLDFCQTGASKDFSSLHAYDDSGASGFLDLGSISHSLQEDVITQPNAHGGSNPRSVSAASSVSIHRTDSKLSDTGSSSGSSATLSTLSHHSDSFCHQSDISNVTVSSVTSSDSNSDSSVISSLRRSSSGFENYNMAYSTHFRPVERVNDNNSQRLDSANGDEERCKNDVYVTLKKDPKQLYMASMKLYEQNEIPSKQVLPSCSSNVKSSSLSSSSSSTSSASSSYSITPRSNVEAPENHWKSNQSNPVTSRLQYGTLSSLSQSTSPSTGNRPRAYSAQTFHNLSSSLPGRSKTFYERDWNLKKENEPKSELSKDELPMDHHANFMKARSYFYHPEDDQVASPSFSSHTVNTTSHSAKSPSENTVQIDMSVKSYVNPNSLLPSTKVTPKDNDKVIVLSDESKKDLPWSVKSLTSIFDKKQPNESASNTHSNRASGNQQVCQANVSVEFSSSYSSINHSRSPTYSQPSNRSQNNSRASTSSTSSTGSDVSANRVTSNPKGQSSHSTFGPQANGLDGYASCSSSEEGYNSSLDRRSKNSPLQESDIVLDHTHITYV